MVTTKEAAIASAVSAGIVGIVHYAAHMYFAGDPDVVMKVGATVVISTFIIAFYGMRRNS
jgi:nitric oxide reductase large subunit